jgi:PIN domain nuclease of toxin-antitoxin system
MAARHSGSTRDDAVTLLLDTHVFLWWLSNPGLLSPAAASAISDPQNRVVVSVVVLWEIAIKRVIGKLTAPIDLETDVVRAGFELLTLEVAHIVATEQLPLHHRDPFDRILVAQALVEGATLVTRDPHLSPYGMPLLTA